MPMAIHPLLLHSPTVLPIGNFTPRSEVIGGKTFHWKGLPGTTKMKGRTIFEFRLFFQASEGLEYDGLYYQEFNQDKHAAMFDTIKEFLFIPFPAWNTWYGGVLVGFAGTYRLDKRTQLMMGRSSGRSSVQTDNSLTLASRRLAIERSMADSEPIVRTIEPVPIAQIVKEQLQERDEAAMTARTLVPTASPPVSPGSSKRRPIASTTSSRSRSSSSASIVPIDFLNTQKSLPKPPQLRGLSTKEKERRAEQSRLSKLRINLEKAENTRQLKEAEDLENQQIDG